MKSTDFSKSTVLLLTACINPNGMCKTVLTDTTQRLEQYLEALRFYLKAIPNRVVFVENTDYDISSYFTKEIGQGRLECLSFNGNDYDKSFVKGYGEALIIEYGIENSAFLKDASTIIKVTGRVKCSNIRTVVRSLQGKNVVYSDFMRQKQYYDLLPSVVVAAPFAFWKLFVDNKDGINDTEGIFFEHILKKTVEEWISIGGRHSYFFCPVFLCGMSGSTGESYAKKHTRLKWMVKSLMYHLYVKKKLFGIGNKNVGKNERPLIISLLHSRSLAKSA